MNKALLTERLRVVPDYPKRGIMFFDVTTLFKDKDCFAEIVDAMYELYKDKGIESRGLVAAAALAHRLGAGFVPVRKPGKLPYSTISEKYSKEYGFDTIEMHTDSISSDDVVLIHDDIWATGGTAAAAVSLVKKFNPKGVYVNFIIDITDIPRTKPISSDVEVTSLLHLREKDYNNI